MKFEYTPKGVCSRHFEFLINNNVIEDFQVVGGCSGNLQGIRKLIIGLSVDDVIEKLAGIKCGGKPTSCPDQIACALKSFKQ